MLKIESYQKIPNPDGCVVAEVDVTIVGWDLTIRKIQECRKGENHWFNWPTKYEEDTTGVSKGKFIPVVSFNSPDICKKFFTAVREELKKLEPQSEEEIPF